MAKQDDQKHKTAPENSNISDDKEKFDTAVAKSHGRVDPCFMTGQGCVYTEVIDRELDTRKSFSGFMIVPFRPNIDSFLRLCLQRYVESYYSSKEETKEEKQGEESGKKVEVVRGDQVRKTGYVICGKICKKIQESNFVLADVSVPNPNVFYELGLAYGINQKIILIHHYKSDFGREITSYLGCKAYSYEDLKKIQPEEFRISQFIWQNKEPLSIDYPFHPDILFIEGNYKYRLPLEKNSLEEQELTKSKNNVQKTDEKNIQKDAVMYPEEDIHLDFSTHVLSAIDVGIETIVNDIEKQAEESKKDSKEIEEYSNTIRKLSKELKKLNFLRNEIEVFFSNILQKIAIYIQEKIEINLGEKFVLHARQDESNISKEIKRKSNKIKELLQKEIDKIDQIFSEIKEILSSKLDEIQNINKSFPNSEQESLNQNQGEMWGELEKKLLKIEPFEKGKELSEIIDSKEVSRLLHILLLTAKEKSSSEKYSLKEKTSKQDDDDEVKLFRAKQNMSDEIDILATVIKKLIGEENKKITSPDGSKFINEIDELIDLVNNQKKSIKKSKDKKIIEELAQDYNNELKSQEEKFHRKRQEYKDKLVKCSIVAYKNEIKNLQEFELVKNNASFETAKKQIQEAYCSVIRTAGPNYDPMAYFWLGYCHALGKNVIPISVVKTENDKINDLAFDIRALWHITFVEDKPKEFSEELKGVLEQMITTDFAEWSRKIFWDKMLGKRGKVSIFTGALHSRTAAREMIGDWDLRTTSELTSYFANHHYRSTIESPIYEINLVRKQYLQKKLGNNTWDDEDEQLVTKSQEQFNNYFNEGSEEDKERKKDHFRKLRKDYIDDLKKMLQDKNCIIIASPDVNPLTEVALGEIYNVPEKEWFGGEEKWINPYKTDQEDDKKQGESQKSKNPDMVKAIKRKLRKDNGVTEAVNIQKSTDFRTFYHEEYQKDQVKKEQRGFSSSSIPEGKFIPEEFYSQIEEKHPTFDTLAHLVIAPNPFQTKDENTSHIRDNKRNYLIILNGISGPATFALTHVLTGGVNNKFVDYDELPESKEESQKGSCEFKSEEMIFFNPQFKSEKILQCIIQDLKLELDSERLEADAEQPYPERHLFTGLQYLIKVTVGPKTSGVEQDHNTQEPKLEILDWRRIKKWELVAPEYTPSRLISDVHLQEKSTANY